MGNNTNTVEDFKTSNDIKSDIRSPRRKINEKNGLKLKEKK